MRNMIRRFIQILDGTPAAYGPRSRGQSIVEMAFITPLILILIAGIVEIGWLANNYLTLQEVTKIGARRGATLDGRRGPLEWDNTASLIPPNYPGDISTYLQGVNIDYTPGQEYSTADANALRLSVRQCDSGSLNSYSGFYNIILCEMLNSLEPLEFTYYGRDDNEIDDIVISVFAVDNIHFADYTGQPFECTQTACDYTVNGEFDFRTVTSIVDKDGFEFGTWNPVVVGRYPTNANECNAQSDEDGNLELLDDNPPERDPFDFVNDGRLSLPETLFTDDPNRPVELWFRDENNNYLAFGRDSVDPTDPYGYDQMERQRGFVFTGNQRITEIDGVSVDCWGSSFSIYDVQDLMRVQRFEMSQEELDAARARAGQANFGRTGTGGDVDVRQFIPSQGVVIVELWWQHDLLLDLPVFSPVLNALGDDQTTLYVWAAFPSPVSEPRIPFFTLAE